MSFCCSTVVVSIAQITSTVPVESIAANYSSPIIPRNGVLMVQLISEILGDNWPTVIDVTTEDGEILQGHVAWIELNNDNTNWANSLFNIRPILPGDDTSNINPKDNSTGPVLLVDLQNKTEGIIRFGGDAIDPVWMDLPSELPKHDLTEIDTSKTKLEALADDMPQWTPLEYWRWVLIASRKGILPPPLPSANEVSRLAALQGEQLWRIGFDRLAKSSRGVAAECRDLLTNTANDNGHTFACWNTHSDSLQRLLSIILDSKASSRQLAMRALNWCSEQQVYMHWLEKAYGNEIELAIANPTHEIGFIALKWREGNDIPLVTELPTKATTRVLHHRIHTMDLSVFGPTTIGSQIQWLDMQIGNRSLSVPIVPESITALPPSVQLQTLHPVWNLQTIHTQVPVIVSNKNKTTVQLRKLQKKWEVFITCDGLPNENTIGIEGITLFHPSTGGELFIPPQGDVVTSNIPLDTNVSQSTSSTSWTARIELPVAWIKNETFAFSILRTHGDSSHIETGPLPCVPWNIQPSSIVVDLSEWDNVKRFPTHPVK